MTTAEGARAPVIPLATAPARFDTPIIVIHWTTAALVVGLFATGWGLGLAADGDTARTLLTVHRSIGVTIWALTCVRMGWRLTGSPAPPLPADLPPTARLGARLNELTLYALLAIQPMTGALQTLYRGKPFDLFAWRIPALIPRDKALARALHEVHEWGAWLLAGLILLHAGAALVHALVRRDGVFQHMAPIRRRRPR